MTDQNLLTYQDIEFVGRLTQEAGRLALKMRSSVAVSNKTGPRDFVTDADIACSKLIVEELQARFPQDLIISEEETGTAKARSTSAVASRRTWMIDPIDGTENYIANDGMYSVMVGLLIDQRPAYGWVYNPSSNVLYVACPGQPVSKITPDRNLELPYVCRSINRKSVKLMMGNRDREQHRWVNDLPGVEFTYNGSVGLRIAMIIEGYADAYVHLSGKLKVWDTAAPAAMAASSGLEVGSFDFDGITYPAARNNMHEYPIAFGRPGTLAWLRQNLREHYHVPVMPPVSTPVV